VFSNSQNMKAGPLNKLYSLRHRCLTKACSDPCCEWWSQGPQLHPCEFSMCTLFAAEEMHAMGSKNEGVSRLFSTAMRRIIECYLSGIGAFKAPRRNRGGRTDWTSFFQVFSALLWRTCHAGQQPDSSQNLNQMELKYRQNVCHNHIKGTDGCFCIDSGEIKYAPDHWSSLLSSVSVCSLLPQIAVTISSLYRTLSTHCIITESCWILKSGLFPN
jgi:hypothetical protein